MKYSYFAAIAGLALAHASPLAKRDTYCSKSGCSVQLDPDVKTDTGSPTVDDCKKLMDNMRGKPEDHKMTPSFLPDHWFDMGSFQSCAMSIQVSFQYNRWDIGNEDLANIIGAAIDQGSKGAQIGASGWAATGDGTRLKWRLTKPDTWTAPPPDTPMAGYKPGGCSAHVVQHQRNEDGVGGEYAWDVQIKDNDKNQIGSVTMKPMDHGELAIDSKLPYTLTISAGGKDEDPVKFCYAGTCWTCNGHDDVGHCTLGNGPENGYENGNRKGDFSFACPAPHP